MLKSYFVSRKMRIHVVLRLDDIAPAAIHDFEQPRFRAEADTQLRLDALNGHLRGVDDRFAALLPGIVGKVH